MSLISRKICSECGSEDVALVEPNSGLWMCKECQYTGHGFFEKEAIGRTHVNADIGNVELKKTKTRRRK